MAKPVSPLGLDWKSVRPMIHGTLPNGLVYQIHYHRHVSNVSINLYVAVGSRQEPSAQDYGIAHFVEHMLFRSTQRSTRGQLLKRIYQGGGTMNATTSPETTNYWCRIGSKWMTHGLDVLSEIIQLPKFDATEFELEKKVLQNELYKVRSDPQDWLSNEVLPVLAFPNQLDLQHSVGGEPDQIARMTREQVLAFYHRWYQPKHMCLVIYGNWKFNIAHKIPSLNSFLYETLNELQSRFGSWKGSLLKTPSSAFTQHFDRFSQVPIPFQPSSYSSVIDSKSYHGKRFLLTQSDLSQTTVVLLWDGPSYLDYPFSLYHGLLVSALVGTMVSRLFLTLREDHGLIYSIRPLTGWSMQDQGRSGLVFSTRGQQPQDTLTALDLIAKERVSLETHGLTKQEIQLFQSYLSEKLRMSRDDTLGMSEWYAEHRLRNHPIQSFRKYRKDMERLQESDIQSATKLMAQRMSQHMMVLFTSPKDQSFFQTALKPITFLSWTSTNRLM